MESVLKKGFSNPGGLCSSHVEPSRSLDPVGLYCSTVEPIRSLSPGGLVSYFVEPIRILNSRRVGFFSCGAVTYVDRKEYMLYAYCDKCLFLLKIIIISIINYRVNHEYLP